MKYQVKGRLARTKLVTALAGTLIFSGAAQGAAIDVGNPDLDLRWDNTLRYAAGFRANPINPAFYNSAAYDETEGKFKQGDLVTNRIDILTEIDLVYQRNLGARFSAAGWDDAAYNGKSRPNPALNVAGAYKNNQYNAYAKRYVQGPSGEVLDAFVFSNFDALGISWSLKAGQHNTYWGESLYGVTNSIAYSQGPIDTIKAASSPGSQAKELFLPIKQLSGQAQLSEEVSLGAIYALSWKPYRLSPGGTFFAPADGLDSDYAANYSSGTNVPNGADLGPEKTHGNFGLSLRYSPSALGASFGIYLRQFDDMLPWAFTQVNSTPKGSSATTPSNPAASMTPSNTNSVPGGGASSVPATSANSPTTPVPLTVRLAYARGTDLLGFSFTKTIASVSIGSELSYRKDTALNSTPGYFVTPANGSSATYAEAEGARGDTMHALINGIWLMPETALWVGGTLIGELNYSRLMKVTKNPQLYFGEGYACPSGQNRSDGCSTKDALGMNVALSPEWPQAFSGVDVAAPLSFGYQLKGNGPGIGGGNEGAINWALGLQAKLYARYLFSVQYAAARARYKTDSKGVVSTTDGANAVQNSHDWLAISFKTTF